MSLFTELLALVGVVRPVRSGRISSGRIALYRRQLSRVRKDPRYCTKEAPYVDLVPLRCKEPTTMCDVAVANAEHWANITYEIWWDEDMSPECGGWNVCPGCAKCPGCIRCRWYLHEARNRVVYARPRRPRYTNSVGRGGYVSRGASPTGASREESFLRLMLRDPRCRNPVLGTWFLVDSRSGFPYDTIVDVSLLHIRGGIHTHCVSRRLPNDLLLADDYRCNYARDGIHCLAVVEL